MNRTVLCGVAAFALLIGAGLALTESSAQAGHGGCGGGLFAGHHRGGCGGGGLFSRHHSNRGCAGAHHARSGCGGGLLARLRARHANNCCAPQPTCCAPAPAPHCEPAPAPCCEPAPAPCCDAGYAQPVQGYSQGYAQPGCPACVGGEVITDSAPVQGGQGAPAPPAPPQQDGGQQEAAPQDAPEAPPEPQPEQSEA